MEVDVLLDQGEATATSLARELPVTRRAVAQHLAVLGRAGLVEGADGGARSATSSAPRGSRQRRVRWPRSQLSGTNA
jgi:DNA-binding transcriptional ArsR family regulator